MTNHLLPSQFSKREGAISERWVENDANSNSKPLFNVLVRNALDVADRYLSALDHSTITNLERDNQSERPAV